MNLLNVFFSTFILDNYKRMFTKYINDKKTAQYKIEIARQENALQSEYKNGCLALVVTDQNFNWIRLAPTYCQMLGYTEQELRQLNWVALHTHEMFTEEKNLYNQLINGSLTHYTIDKEMKHKEDRLIYIRSTVIYQKVHKELTYFVRIEVDITELKETEMQLRATEHQLNQILNHGNIGINDWSLSNNKVYYNAAIATILGCSQDSLKKRDDFLKYIHPDDLPHYINKVAQCLSGKSDHYENDYRIISPSNEERWLRGYGCVVARDMQEQPTQVYGLMYDVTELYQQDDSLTIFASIYQSSNEAMMVVDNDFNVISVNQAFTKLTAIEEYKIEGQPFTTIPLKMDTADFFWQISASINDSGCWSGEMLLERTGLIQSDRIEKINIWLTINAVYKETDEKQIDYFLVLFIDITQRKQAEHKIWYQAHFDELTALPNRRYFIDEMQKHLKQAHPSKQKMALFYIDLDDFKQVNDSFGFAQGDHILKLIATRLQKRFAPDDFVARLSDDEFVLLRNEVTNQAQIEDLAKQLLTLITQPIVISINDEIYASDHYLFNDRNDKLDDELDDEINQQIEAPQTIFVNACIGIALYPDDGKELNELLKLADQSMYIAKKKGTGQYQFSSLQIQQQAQQRMSLIYDLYDAIINNEFEIFYQPIMSKDQLQNELDLKSPDTNIVQVEVFVRWNHPTLGLLRPSMFIAIAEEIGLIYELSHWAFNVATTQLAEWNKQGYSVVMSFNQSPILFKDERFNIDYYLNHLKKLKIEPQQIIIEITEVVLLDEHTNEVLKQLQYYRDAGIRIALDDYGTGYSSLSYISRFVVDFIKIDEIFIRNLEHDPVDRALCETIMTLAHQINIEVVAEGVESKEQLDILQQLNCDYLQGYYFCHPMNVKEFNDYLNKISRPNINKEACLNQIKLN